MRALWIAFCAVLFATSSLIASSGKAQSFCTGPFVLGNETEAPAALTAAFQTQNWAKVEDLLTDDVTLTLADWDTKLTKGKRNTIAVLRDLYTSVSENGEANPGFNTVKLSANHWVTARLFPEFKSKESYNPLLISPHPRYYPFYSVAFMPDCRGKVSRIVLVERSLVSD